MKASFFTEKKKTFRWGFSMGVLALLFFVGPILNLRGQGVTPTCPTCRPLMVVPQCPTCNPRA